MPPNHGEAVITAQNVDLSNCDREQVQFCGAIQPHGVLLALSEPDFVITHISANTEATLGLASQDLLATRLINF